MSIVLLSYGNVCFTVTNAQLRRMPDGIPDGIPDVPSSGRGGGSNGRNPDDHPSGRGGDSDDRNPDDHPSRPGGDSNGGNPSGFPFPGGSWPGSEGFSSGSGSPVNMPMVCVCAKLNRHSDTSGNFVHVVRNVYLGNTRYQPLAHYTQRLCYGM